MVRTIADSLEDLELERGLADAISSAMRIEVPYVPSGSWLRSFLTERIELLISTGKGPVDRQGASKPFGPKSLLQEIFGSWNAIPQHVRDVLESNKTLKDDLGRAHNRLAKLISDIQRTSPRTQSMLAPLGWEDLLRQDLMDHRDRTLNRLFRLLADHGTTSGISSPGTLTK